MGYSIIKLNFSQRLKVKINSFKNLKQKYRVYRHLGSHLNRKKLIIILKSLNCKLKN